MLDDATEVPGRTATEVPGLGHCHPLNPSFRFHSSLLHLGATGRDSCGEVVQCLPRAIDLLRAPVPETQEVAKKCAPLVGKSADLVLAGPS